MKKTNNLLAENMRRFGTKNLNEQQMDMFNWNPETEYIYDRPHTDDKSADPEDMMHDLKQAMRRKEGRAAAQVANKLLKYISVDVYDNLKSAEDQGVASYYQDIIDAVQQINQDVIKDTIKVLKVSPNNMPAMQTIYAILKDLISAIEH